MTTLSVANRLMSLRGRIDITDDQDRIAYHARGEFAFLAPTWRVYRGQDVEGEPLALIRRKLWSWGPTWEVQVEGGPFQFKRKLWSWRRRYHVLGGRYDGAEVAGNLWDMSFSIMYRDTVLATAVGKLLSLRDRHRVEIPGEGELFVVVAMVVLQIDRRSESGQASAD